MTPVKPYQTILIALLTTLVLACAGANSKQIKPKHLTSGMQQIKKGNELYQKGCYKRSIEHFFRAHERFAASDQVAGVAMSMNNIGTVYRILGDTTDALRFFNESYRMYQDLNDPAGRVRVLSNIAATLLGVGKLTEAEPVIDTADRLAADHGIMHGPLLRNRGILFAKKKAYQRAETILNRALTDVDPSNLSEFAAINAALGNLMAETDRTNEAIEFFKDALVADRQSGFTKGMGDDLAAIGKTYHGLEAYSAASSYYQRSLKIYALIGNTQKVRDIMGRLEKIAEETGRDASITKEFAASWLKGAANSPCE